jgi:hypothetical protein
MIKTRKARLKTLKEKSLFSLNQRTEIKNPPEIW